MFSQNTSRIACNTALLYIRMLLIMSVTLYTSRVVLEVLGVEDYGIYSIAGGIVVLFGFLNSAVATGTQRFLSYQIGKKDFEELKKTFQIAMNIHIGIGLIIWVIAETVGVWLLHSGLNIPSERMEAAGWVYHCSVFSFLVTVIRMPYNALIIAHERMKVYTYMSVIEASLRLFVAYLLIEGCFDKLKFYAILMLCVSLTIALTYGLYGRRQFRECRFGWSWDRARYRQMLNYTGWNLWGSLAWAGYTQGVNLLLNIYFSPVINAARAISFQVNGAIVAFLNNFQLAVTPQIVKSYASGDRKYMLRLVFYGSKYSFLLLSFLSVPLLLEMPAILQIWLKQVPPYAVLFCRLVLVNVLIDSFSGTLMIAFQAIGKIKKYQFIVGTLLLLNLPLSYLFLSRGYPPETVYCISISLAVMALASRLVLLRQMVEFKVSTYMRDVFASISVTLLSASFAGVLSMNLDIGFLRLLIVVICSSFSFLFFGYVVGLTREEKLFVNQRFCLYAQMYRQKR